MLAIPPGGATASPLYVRPGPVATPISENGRRAASHSLIPVAPGEGALSRIAAVVDQMDIANGVDRTTGHGGQMKLAPACNRNARGDRPGAVSTAESLGPMSGPLA